MGGKFSAEIDKVVRRRRRDEYFFYDWDEVMKRADRVEFWVRRVAQEAAG